MFNNGMKYELDTRNGPNFCEVSIPDFTAYANQGSVVFFVLDKYATLAK